MRWAICVLRYRLSTNLNQSSTWQPKNLYGLGNGAELNYTGNGMYGLDTVGLQLPLSGGVSLPNQVVAGKSRDSSRFKIYGHGRA